MKENYTDDFESVFESVDKSAMEELYKLKEKYPDQDQLLQSKEYSALVKSMVSELKEGIDSKYPGSRELRNIAKENNKTQVKTFGLNTINIPISLVIFIICVLFLAIYFGATA